MPKKKRPIYEVYPTGSYGKMVVERERVLTGKKAELGVYIVERVRSKKTTP